MDVEFEEVEEGVGDEVDGAVEVAFDAEGEFKWAAGFVAGWERDVLELAGCVCDLREVNFGGEDLGWRCVHVRLCL